MKQVIPVTNRLISIPEHLSSIQLCHSSNAQFRVFWKQPKASAIPAVSFQGALLCSGKAEPHN